MASNDQLWFEIGVRDNVTKVLNDILDKAEDIKDKMGDLNAKSPAYDNALKIEQAYDKIAVAIRKIEQARGKTTNTDELDRLDKMQAKLVEVRKAFENLTADEVAMGTKGQAAFTATQQGLRLALDQVDRYTKSIDDASKAEARQAQEELRRTDALKAKYNELVRYRKQWNDVMSNVAPGTTINGATRRMGQSLDYRFNQVAAAIASGGDMPKSAAGADYDEFIRRVKERMRELTAETNNYNNALAKNESVQRSVNAAMNAADSQRRIAGIKGMQSEYTALTSKLQDLQSLSAAIAADMTNVQNGGAPVYTQARVTEELTRIQQRYSEALAALTSVERKDAEAKRAAVQAARELTQAQQGLVSAYDRVTQAGQRSNGVLQQLQLQMGTYFSLLGAERLVRNVIQIGGEFEVQHIALQSILGDIQQANSMFEQMKELAVVSPFNFRQLAQYSKQVAAFGVPYEEMYDTTKRLADMSAGLGVDMGRLILAYGQVRSAAVLRGQELRQFTEAGIPMVQALANEFTKLNGRAVSTAEVFELISKRAVPFEMVKKVLWDMTNEGGRFYDMQYTLADTLAGKWSNLQDAWEIMLSDIAKGESMSGKLLKTMVGGITALIENVNTLLPLIGGVVSFFGMRGALRGVQGMFNLGNYGLNGVENNIKKAQALHAIELKRRYLNMQITQEQYKQGLALNKNKQNYYMMLAQEGRLKEIQIARAVQQGRINTGRLQERILSGEITTREAAQLRLWRMKYAQANLFKLNLRGIGASINAMLGPIGWASIAFDVLLTTILSVSSHMSEVAQKNKDLSDGFANRAKELSDSLKGLQGGTLSTDEDYQRGIDGLKEMLKQHSANYDAIIQEASGLKTLQEQYEYLKRQLSESMKVYSKAQEESESFGDATRDGFEKAKAASRDYFKLIKKYPYLAKAAPDDNELFGDFREATGKIAEEIKKILPNVGADEFSNNVFRQLRDAMIQELGVGSRESMMIKIRLNELLDITDYSEGAELVQQSFEDMLNQAAPNIANKIRYGKTLEKAEQEKVQSLMNDVIRQTGDKYPAFANYLQGLLNDSNFTANIQLRIAGGLSASELQSTLFKNLPKTVSVDSQKRISGWLNNVGNDIYAARNKAKQDIDAAKNNVAAYDNAIAKGKKELIPLRDKARSNYLGMVGDALLGLGYDYEGELKKSNKPTKTGGTKKDVLLDKAKTRLEEINDFYSEYKKYRDQYGKEKGLSMVEQLFGMEAGSGKDIVENYRGKLNEILAAVPQNTEARKKFALGIKKLIGDIDLDAAKTELQKRLEELQRYIQDETSKWNLYKGLLEKTGSKEFAMQAFVDGVQWDDMTRGMAEKLREAIGGKYGEGIFDMDETTAEAFFGKGTEELKLWQEIVKDIRKNWTDGLNEVAAATEKLMTIEDKIAKTERELADLRQKYGMNDPRALAKERDLGKLNADAFEQSEPYLRFYSGVFAMTADEAESVGAKIKENLVDQLARGEINADKYLKSIKNIDQQLEKARGVRSDAMTLLTGGYRGLMEKRGNAYDSQAAVAAIKIQKAEEDLAKARLEGNKMAETTAKIRIALAKKELTDAQKRMGWNAESLKQANKVLEVMELISGAIDGMRQAAQQLSDMFDALGHEHVANTWSDIADTIGAIGSPVSEAMNTLKSAMSGDVGGIVSHGVGIFTSPITAFAKLHDKKQQRKIEDSERKVRYLTSAYQSLQSAMEKALGGIYVSGGYDEMLENLKNQRDELQRQYEAESGKKKKDADKLADYEQQIKDADESIKNFALDMAKSLYDIDLHSWASELTDAVVSAWENGEDAAEAYRDKVKDIMKDLTTNILAKKVMERAFESLGIDDIIAGMMDAKSGKLDETMIPKLAESLGKVGTITVDTITGVLDSLESQGYIEKDGSGSSKSGASNTIKGVTEETADLLASYINAIRADVSVNRMTLTEILYAVQGQSDMPMIARAQLQQLEQVAQNTQRNADAAEMIYEMLHQNVLGANFFRVK